MSEISEYYKESEFIKLFSNKFPNRINLESISNDIEGLKILVKPEFSKDPASFLISFEDVEQYTVTPRFPFKSLDSFDTPNWGIYKNISDNNGLLKRYHEETARLCAGWPIKHYVIIGVNDDFGCIDVLSQSELKVVCLSDQQVINLEEKIIND